MRINVAVFSVRMFWIWIDMSSEGRDVDDYIFTTSDEQSTPYIQWFDPAVDRSSDRCTIIIANDRNFGQHPRGCNAEIRLKYVCERESNELFSLKKIYIK